MGLVQFTFSFKGQKYLILFQLKTLIVFISSSVASELISYCTQKIGTDSIIKMCVWLNTCVAVLNCFFICNNVSFEASVGLFRLIQQYTRTMGGYSHTLPALNDKQCYISFFPYFALNSEFASQTAWQGLFVSMNFPDCYAEVEMVSLGIRTHVSQ